LNESESRTSPRRVRVLALVVGAVVVALLQPWALGPMTEALFGEPFQLAWPFWMPIASTLALLVCLIPRGPAPTPTEQTA